MERLSRLLMSALIIGLEKSDWLRIIFEIEHDLNCAPHGKRAFLMDFLEWLEEALKHVYFRSYGKLMITYQFSFV